MANKVNIKARVEYFNVLKITPGIPGVFSEQFVANAI